jgi:phospholipid/cholesterol/gamma-HCH transport system substrate-binding protein
MSRRRRNLQRNVTLGAFVLAALAGLTALTFRLGAFDLRKRQQWTAYFGIDSTVKKDADVYVAGMKVGRVTRVRLVPDAEIAPGRYVQVDMEIREVTLWQDATVIMQSRGLLGRAVLELDRGTPGTRVLTPDTPLRGVMSGDPFDALNGIIKENRSNLARITSDLAAVTGKLSRGEGSVGRILGDDELYRKIDRIADGLGELIDRANSKESAIGALLHDRTLYDNVLAISSDLRDVSGQIRSGKGTIGRAIYDDEAATNLKQAIAHVNRIVQAIDEGEGTIGKLLREDVLHTSLREGVDAFRDVGVRLSSGKGTFSRLLSDDGQIFENLRVASEDVRVMLDDLRGGKGTLGLLLKDDKVYRELERTVQSFRETGEVARENAPLASLVSFTSLFFNVLN